MLVNLHRAAALATLGLVLAAPARAALPPTATQDHWTVTTTSRFRILSNGGQAAATRAARQLERLAETMERSHLGIGTDAARPTWVYVFRDAASFDPFIEQHNDEFGSTVGFHVPGIDVDYIAYCTPASGASMEFVNHEYTHAAVYRRLGRLAPWLDEGMAEFFSTFEAGSKTATIGKSKPDQIRWLAEKHLPLRRLLLISRDSPEYVAGENRVTLYAEAWALVHMLMMDDDVDPARFNALVHRIASGTGSVEALQAVYGPNAVDSLDARLLAFSRSPQVSYINRTFDAEFDQMPVQISELNRAQTAAALGELLVHSDESRLPAAGELLHAAWVSDSSRSATAAWLGYAAERQTRTAEADGWFRTVARAMGDPRADGIAGTVLARRFSLRPGPAAIPAPGPDSTARFSRTLLDRALAANPDHPEWLASFGETFLDDTSSFESGMGALMQAQQQLPGRCDVVGSLAILSLRAGNRGGSVAVYKRIPEGTDRRFWRWKSGTLIAQQSCRDAYDLIRAGRSADAESLVVRVRRDVQEAGTARMYDETIQAARATSH